MTEEKAKKERLCLGFLTMLEVSGSYKVDLAIEQQRDVLCKLFELLCFVLLQATPVP